MGVDRHRLAHVGDQRARGADALTGGRVELAQRAPVGQEQPAFRCIGDASGGVDVARQNLASYQKPRSVEFVPELPKAPTGKILKRKLREPYWEGADRQV